MILELCDSNVDTGSHETPKYDKNLNPFECDEEQQSTTSKPRFSFGDVKLSNVKRFIKQKREKTNNDLCLKITTSKMRCSIKVKEGFENDAGKKLLDERKKKLHDEN